MKPPYSNAPSGKTSLIFLIMKDTSVPSQKKITAAEIGLHVSSTLRDLSVIFWKIYIIQ